MQNLPKAECSYCQYDRPYRKNTTIWNNFDLKLATCKCTTKHKVKLGGDYGGTPGCRKWAKYKHKISVPQKLILEIIRQLRNKVRSTTETQIQTNSKVQINKTENETIKTATQTEKQQLNYEPCKCCINHNYTQAQNPASSA